MNIKGALEISEQRTWLPIHRNWILILGIRSDEGKLPPQLKGRAASTPRMPGLGDRAKSQMLKAYDSLWNFQSTRRRNTLVDEAVTELQPLFGTFGTLWTMEDMMDSPRHKVYYRHHISEEYGNSALNTLDIHSLFWLAVGCIPLGNGDLYSLANCALRQGVQERQNASGRAGPRMDTWATHAPHFDNDSSDDEWDHKGMLRASSYTVPSRRKYQQQRPDSLPL